MLQHSDHWWRLLKRFKCNRAIYGRLIAEGSDEVEETELAGDVIEVTIPLQCLVKDSKLLLQEASKVNKFEENGTGSVC